MANRTNLEVMGDAMSETVLEPRQEIGWQRNLWIACFVLLPLLGAAGGAILGVLSLDAQGRLHGPGYASPRYSDVGGGFRAIVEALIEAAMAALVGVRSGWYVASLLSVLVRKKSLLFGRLGWVDLFLVPPLLLWAYLAYVSW